MLYLDQASVWSGAGSIVGELVDDREAGVAIWKLGLADLHLCIWLTDHQRERAIR